ncbi:MAG TPA: ribonuclease domain-containing protein [Propionibacteriaceae bacterium]|nr:ribonuclease domain-containing protein [Propionibacteriaceae bacterium]
MSPGIGARSQPARGRALTCAALVIVLAGIGLLWARPDSGSLTAEPAGTTTPTSAETVGDATAGSTATRRAATDAETGLLWVELGRLPAEARQTVELIESGGPFPYDKDGVVFGNREGILPQRARGYYREYTVPTPGSDDRGARRIVTGDRHRQLFYTDDHYSSFERIRR